jgi:hypothetical protein
MEPRPGCQSDAIYITVLPRRPAGHRHDPPIDWSTYAATRAPPQPSSVVIIFFTLQLFGRLDRRYVSGDLFDRMTQLSFSITCSNNLKPSNNSKSKIHLKELSIWSFWSKRTELEPLCKFVKWVESASKLLFVNDFLWKVRFHTFMCVCSGIHFPCI